MQNDNTEQAVQQPVQQDVSSGKNPKTLLKFPFPLLIVTAYLALGFLLDAWHPGWLIFLFIPIYYQLAAMAVIDDLRKKLQAFPIAVLCVLIYLSVGTFFGLWHPTWLVFLVIPVYHILAAQVKKPE